jgi:hypothetical protein
MDSDQGKKGSSSNYDRIARQAIIYGKEIDTLIDCYEMTILLFFSVYKINTKYHNWNSH